MTEFESPKLADNARELNSHLTKLGFSRNQIHGFYFLIGMQTNMVTSKEDEVDIQNANYNLIGSEVINTAQLGTLIPFSSFTDHIGELLYLLKHGYEARGLDLSEQLAMRLASNKLSGLFKKDIKPPKNMRDHHRLFMQFYEMVGGELANIHDDNLMMSLLNGRYQIEVFAFVDSKVALDLIASLKISLDPLLTVLHLCILKERQIVISQMPYPQIALQSIFPNQQPFISIAWPFQSWIFYEDGNLIEGLEEMDIYDFWNHSIQKAILFAQQHYASVPPFSTCTFELDGLLRFGKEFTFEHAAEFIASEWGLEYHDLKSKAEEVQFKALVVHCIICSIMKTKDTIN